MLKIDHLPIDDIPDDDIANDLTNMKQFYDQLSAGTQPDDNDDKSAGNPEPSESVTSSNHAVGTSLESVTSLESDTADEEVSVSKSNTELRGVPLVNDDDAKSSDKDTLYSAGKSDIESYMNFLRANKIINKNKHDLTRPEPKPSRDKSHVSSRKLVSDKKSYEKSNNSESRSSSTDTKKILQKSNNVDKYFEKSKNVRAKNDRQPSGKTFQEMMSNLQKQLYGLNNNSSDPLTPPASDSILTSNSESPETENNPGSDLLEIQKSRSENDGSESERNVSGNPVKSSKTKQELRATNLADVKRRGKLKSNVPPPDVDEDELPSNDAELDGTVLANMAADVDRNHGNGSVTYVVDEGRDKVDIDTGRNWFTRVHGHRDVIVAGCVVAGLGLLLVLAYVVHALIVRRRERRKGGKTKAYRQSGEERERLLMQNNFSLFPSDSVSEESESDETDQNASWRW